MNRKYVLQKLQQLIDSSSCTFFKKALYNDYLALKKRVNKELRNSLITKYKLK